MLNLDSLSTGEQGNSVSLDTLTTKDKAPIGDPSNNSEQALFTSIAANSDPSKLVQDFHAYRDSLNEESDASPMMSTVDQIKQQYAGDMTKYAANALVDESVPVETRKNIPLVLKDAQNTSVRKVVAEKFATADNGDEGINQENARTSVLNKYDEVLKWKKDKSQALAVVKAQYEAGDKSSWKEFITDWIPGVQGSKVSRVNQLISAESAKQQGIPDFGMHLTEFAGGVMSKEALQASWRKQIDSLPPSQRLDQLKKILGFISQVNSTGALDENDYSTLQMAQNLVENYDSMTSAFAKDTLFNILNLTPIGGSGGKVAEQGVKTAEEGVVKQAAKTSPEIKLPEDIIAKDRTMRVNAITNAMSEYVRGNVAPTSLLQTAAETNPTMAKEILASLDTLPEDAVRTATGGMTKEEALADLALPEVKSSTTDAVRPKPQLFVDEQVKVSGTYDPGLNLTTKEIKKLTDERLAAFNGVQSSAGVSVRPEMTSISDTEYGQNISAMYGDGNTGFNSASDMVNRVAYSLKTQGIRPEDITVMQRTPEGYKPLAKGIDVESLPKGDYMARVDTTLPYESTFDKKALDVRFNAIDRIGGISNFMVGHDQGTVSSHFFHPGQQFTKQIAGAAQVAVDNAAFVQSGFAHLGKDFEKSFGKLNAVEKEKVASYLMDANRNQIPFDREYLLHDKGFSERQIESIAHFKTINDTAWVLENRDYVKSMSSRGYGMYTDSTGSELLARKLHRNVSIDGIREVYDPVEDRVINFNQAMKDEVYNKGYHLAELKDHLELNGGNVNHILVRDSADSYLRALNPEDKILQYREGYYKVAHKENFFVIRNIKDKSGKVLYTKAIGKADSVHEAETVAKSIADRHGGMSYIRDNDGKSDLFLQKWNKQFSGEGKDFDGTLYGRSSQRFRGKPLETYDPTAEGLSNGRVLSPIEAIQHTTSSLSNRTSMRSFIENYRKRFLAVYEDMLPVDKNTGLHYIPDDISKIGTRSGISTGRLADARSHYAYMNMLERGNVDAMDKMMSDIASYMADITANNKDLGKLEKGLLAVEKVKPSSLAKATAFYMTLGSNLFGAMITQGSQGLSNLMFTTLNPYFYKQMFAISAAVAKVGPKSLIKEGETLVDDLVSSGMTQATNIHGLRSWAEVGTGGGSLTSLSFKRPITSIFKILQLGNAAGEDFNLVTAWLAKRSDFALANGGRNPTSRELAEIHAQARTLSFSMNRAGEYAFQKNSLGVIMQFKAALLKAITVGVLDKDIPFIDRLRVVLAPAMLYGLPAGLTSYLTSTVQTTEGLTQETKDNIQKHLEGSLVGGWLSRHTGTDIYMGKFNPLDVQGMASTLFDVTENMPISFFTKSPAGSVYTNKVQPLFKTFGQWVGLTEPESGIPTTGEDFLKKLGEMTTGTSNAMKAYVMYKTGVMKSGKGDIIQSEVTKEQAIAKFFGIDTQNYMKYLRHSDLSFDGAQAQFATDFKTFLDNVQKDLNMHEYDKGTFPYYQQMIYAVNKAYGDNPTAQKLMLNSFRADMLKNGENSLIIQGLKASGYMTERQLYEYGNTIPDNDQRNQFMDMLKQMKEMKDGE